MPAAAAPAAHIHTSVLHIESAAAADDAAVLEHPLENTTVLRVLYAARGQLTLQPGACICVVCWGSDEY